MMINSMAVIEDGAEISDNVFIDAYTIIRKNVSIGRNTRIEAFCELGSGNSDKLIIPDNSIIRSHSVFYGGSCFGEGLETGHRVTIRENTKAGINLRVGTQSDIQGDCIIGNYNRFHSNVHISKHTLIGSFVWLFPFVVTTNDPHPPSDFLQGVVIKDYVAISTMSVILPGVTIAKNSIVGAHSKVTRDTEEGYLYSGNPAKKTCAAERIRLKDGSRRPAYPWTQHFHTGYPEEITQLWKQG